MKAKKFTSVPIKPQGEFASREEYQEGACLRCDNCGDGRLVRSFPDDPKQPDGVSPFCDRCDSRVRQAIAAHQFAAGTPAPTESRAQVAARMRKAAADAAAAQAAEGKATIPNDANPLKTPDPTEESEPTPAGEEPTEGEEQEAARHDGEPVALNSGEMTNGAKLAIEANGYDLSLIVGRVSDGKVGIPEVEAWKDAQELEPDEEPEEEDQD